LQPKENISEKKESEEKDKSKADQKQKSEEVDDCSCPEDVKQKKDANKKTEECQNKDPREVGVCAVASASKCPRSQPCPPEKKECLKKNKEGFPEVKEDMACGDCGDCCPPGHTPPPPHHPYHGCGGCGPPGGCGPCGPYPPPPGYCPPGCGSCYYKSWLHAQQTQHDYFHSMENYHKSMSEAYRNKAAHVRSHMC